jgi:outer membrane immunogenic protein
MSNVRGAALSAAVLFGLACNAQGQPAEPPRLQGPGHFSGLFLGANIGAAIGSTGEVNTSGYISGAHIGYDLQMSRIFVGVEADIMSTSISAGDFKSSKYEQNFLSSARARAGYIFADLALYATGGLGFATTAFKSAASIDKSSVKGWAYGIGVEWQVIPKVAVRGEILRYDFGAQSYVTPLQTATITSYTDVLRAGAHYRF